MANPVSGINWNPDNFFVSKMEIIGRNKRNNMVQMFLDNPNLFKEIFEGKIVKRTVEGCIHSIEKDYNRISQDKIDTAISTQQKIEIKFCFHSGGGTLDNLGYATKGRFEFYVNRQQIGSIFVDWKTYEVARLHS